VTQEARRHPGVSEPGAGPSAAGPLVRSRVRSDPGNPPPPARPHPHPPDQSDGRRARPPSTTAPEPGANCRPARDQPPANWAAHAGPPEGPLQCAAEFVGGGALQRDVTRTTAEQTVMCTHQADPKACPAGATSPPRRSSCPGASRGRRPTGREASLLGSWWPGVARARPSPTRTPPGLPSGCVSSVASAFARPSAWSRLVVCLPPPPNSASQRGALRAGPAAAAQFGEGWSGPGRQLALRFDRRPDQWPRWSALTLVGRVRPGTCRARRVAGVDPNPASDRRPAALDPAPGSGSQG